MFNVDGTLAGDRIVTQGANVLAFTATEVNAFSVDGTTFSVDANNGRVGIGTDAPSETLHVEGDAFINGEITTATSIYPDYVFEDYLNGYSMINSNYKFSTLEDVMNFIKANNHLPGVTSIKELQKNEEGEYRFNVSELSIQLLEKVEELYLHTIDQEKELKEKDQKIQNLEERLKKIEAALNITNKQ